VVSQALVFETVAGQASEERERPGWVWVDRAASPTRLHAGLKEAQRKVSLFRQSPTTPISV
jgi:hypothetical protein